MSKHLNGTNIWRAKRTDNREWETGALVVIREGCHDEQAFIADKMTGYLTPVDLDTASQQTGIFDEELSAIYTDDIVNMFGNIGRVVFEEGAFGIAFSKVINWEALELKIPEVTGCNNGLFACCNDNFVSLWELVWNFNGEENCCPALTVIGNIQDNPELLPGYLG